MMIVIFLPKNPCFKNGQSLPGYAGWNCKRTSARITGFTPEDLYRRMAEDESFWSYRLWQ